MTHFYVYIYYDPQTLIPFYVGKGSKRRYKKHLHETWNNTTNKMRLSKIISIRSKELEPIVHIYMQDLTEQQALVLEESIIKSIGKKVDGTGPLTNILDGGAQPPKGVGNPVWKYNNPSISHKGKTYEEIYGKLKSKRIKEKRSHSLKGRQFSEDTLNKMSRSAKSRNDRSYQFKKVHTPRGVFDSCSAAAKNFDISQSSVTNRCQSQKLKWIDWYYL